MKLKTVKDELWLIGKTYPTLAGLMMKPLPGGKTVGHHWAVLLQDLNAVHFENVCYELANLETPLPEPHDQLPFYIRQEVKDRTYREDQRREQHEKVHSREKYKCTSKDIWYQWMHKLIARREKLTDEQMDELCGWTNHQKPKPEWIEACFGSDS